MTKENQITTTNNNGSFLTDKGAFEHTWRVATAFSKNNFINGVNVLDDKGTTYSVEEFLDKIKKLKVRVQS